MDSNWGRRIPLINNLIRRNNNAGQLTRLIFSFASEEETRSCYRLQNHQVRIRISIFSVTDHWMQLTNEPNEYKNILYLPVIFCMRLAHVKPVTHHHRTPYYNLGPEANEIVRKPFNSTKKKPYHQQVHYYNLSSATKSYTPWNQI